MQAKKSSFFPDCCEFSDMRQPKLTANRTAVKPINSWAERQLRPMAIKRRLTFGNRSDLDASNKAVMMSVVEAGVRCLMA